MAIVKHNGEIYRLSRATHYRRQSEQLSSSSQARSLNRHLLSPRSEDRPILWVLRPDISDQESTSIAVIVAGVLVIILATFFLIRCISARRANLDINSNVDNRRRSLWAGIKWQKGEPGEASFIPADNSYQVILDQHTPPKVKSSAGVSQLFSKKRKSSLSFTSASISPYPYKVTPRTSHKLFGASTSPPASPYTDLTPLQSPSDCFRNSKLHLDHGHNIYSKGSRSDDLDDGSASTSLTAPEKAICSPKSHFNNDLSKYATQRKTGIPRKMSLLVSPFMDQHTPLPNCSDEPNVYFNKSHQEAQMIGLGLKVGEPSIPSRSEDLADDSLQGTLCWQPIEAISPSMRRAKEAESNQSLKGKEKAKEIFVVEVEDELPHFEIEAIEKYTGPVYADQIADALKEAQVDPIPLWNNTGEKVPVEHNDERRNSQMGDFTRLYYETMDKLQRRSQRRLSLIQRSPIVKRKPCYRTKDRSASESTAKSLIGAAISEDLPSSPTSEAPVSEANQVGLCQRQRTRTSAVNFHLPLRASLYTGTRPLCSSPESIRRKSLQVIKIRGRSSLVPNIHVPSASIDTEASGTSISMEISGYSFQRLFWDEFGQSKASFTTDRKSSQFQRGPFKSYSDEERELEEKERRHSFRSLKESVRCSTMSTTHSTAVPCYRQPPSRFSSFSTASRKSTASHYSQESRQSIAAFRTISPKSVSRNIDEMFRSRKTRSSTSSNTRRMSEVRCCKRCSRKPTTSFDSGFFWDLNDFSLSDFPAVPPLPLQNHPLLSLMGEEEDFENIFKASYTTQPLQLFRHRSPSGQSHVGGESRNSIARKSDHISPTLIITRLYSDDKSDSESEPDNAHAQIEEDAAP